MKIVNLLNPNKCFKKNYNPSGSIRASEMVGVVGSPTSWTAQSLQGIDLLMNR